MPKTTAFSLEIVEAMTVKWCEGYSFNDLAREYATDSTTVKRCIRRHVKVTIVTVENLEQKNSWLWEQRLNPGGMK